MNISITAKPRGKSLPASAIKPRIEGAIEQTKEDRKRIIGNSLGDLKVYPNIYNSEAQIRQMEQDIDFFEAAKDKVSKETGQEDPTVGEVISAMGKQVRSAEWELYKAQKLEDSHTLKSRIAMGGTIALSAGAIAAGAFDLIPTPLVAAFAGVGTLGMAMAGAYQNNRGYAVNTGLKERTHERLSESFAHAHMWMNYAHGE